MQLQKVVTRRKKRLGHGAGSGKGFHTSGRGQKGQKARGSVHILFEGMKAKKSLIRRLPMQRGMGKFKPKSVRPIVINLEILELFMPANLEVNLESLVKAGIVREKDAKMYGIKILGDGKLTKKLTIKLPISETAKKKVLDAGGTVS